MNFATLAYMTDAEFYSYIDKEFGMTNQETARLRAVDLLERYIREQSLKRVDQRQRLPTMEEARHMREFKYK